MTITAQYKGTTNQNWENGETYTVTFNSNSMIALKNDSKDRIIYRSITEFLRQWDNIQQVKN